MQTFKTLDQFAEYATREMTIRAMTVESPTLKDFGVSLDIMDVVDGYYIARPVVRYGAGRTAVYAVLETGTDTPVELSGGPANAEIDKHSGNILINPKSSEPVFATGRVISSLAGNRVTLTSGREEIGISTDFLPSLETDVQLAGGGACAARWQKAAAISFEIQVRASIMANVMPRSLTRREVSWRNGRYFAYHPQLGFMSLYYDPDRSSRIKMTSNNEERAERMEGFFPATALNEIYFICDFVDLGISTFSKKPMAQTISETDWPPFKNTVLNIDAPLDFYNVEDPDELVMRIEKQSMNLYDYNSIDVELLESRIIEDDVLVTRWRISNQSDDLVYGRWFLLGDFEKNPAFSHEGNRLLGPAKGDSSEYIVESAVKVSKSTLRQRISMNVVNVRDTILSGAKPYEFYYPEL